jgi:2-keto-3-deoxy-L-rhamnonate aldolase RhmA
MNAPQSRLLELVESGVVPLGMQCFTGDPSIIEVLGLSGFDYVMLDTEHSGSNPRAIEPLIRVADSVGLLPFVRVPSAHDEVAIRRAFEAGAQGVFLPMVKTVEDVLAAASAAYFPPVGNRGICPAVRAAGYSFSTFGEYAEHNNATALLIPLIEHPTAVENIEEICAMPEVRVITFGAGDLAYAMGEGTLMMRSPKVQEAYRRVLAAAKANGVAVIGGPVLDPSEEACRKALDDGVNIFCLGLDTMAFRRACEETVDIVARSVAGTTFSRPPQPASAFPGR